MSSNHPFSRGAGYRRLAACQTEGPRSKRVVQWGRSAMGRDSGWATGVDIAVWHAKDVWAWAIIPNRSGNEEKYLEPL